MDDLRGQDGPREFLKRLAAEGGAGRAYLFLGPEGSGKLLAAKALAGIWLCAGAGRPGGLFGGPAEAELRDRACGRCPACAKLKTGNHPDFILLQPAEDKENILIDQARELIKALRFASMEGKNRVVVIPRAERFSLEAANALLKTLEEPPLDTAFILTAAEAELLPATVRSRCQIVRFRALPESLVRREIEAGGQVDENLSLLAATLAQGSLDQALAQDWGEVLAQRREILERFWKIGPADAAALLDLSKDLSAEAAETSLFLTLLLTWYRDLLVAAGGGDPEPFLINRDLAGRIRKTAAAAPPETWADKLRAVFQAEAAISARANPRLALEALMLKLAPGFTGAAGVRP